MRLNFLRRDRHETWQQDLDAYVDGELAAPAATVFEHHLAACQLCQPLVEQARFAKVALTTMPVLHAPRSFAISEAMLARSTPRKRTAPGPVYRMAQATAFAALAGFATLVIVDATRDSSAETATFAAPAAGIAESAPVADSAGANATGPAVQDGASALTTEGATPEDGVGAAGSDNNYDAGQDDAGQDDAGQRTPDGAEKLVPGDNPSDGSAPPPLALETEDDGGPAGLRMVQGALAALAAVMGATWFILRRRHRSL
jgi:anti-sigma factor RsiW